MIAALRPSWVNGPRRGEFTRKSQVERCHAFGELVAEAADMADRKCFGRGVHGEAGMDNALDPARGDDRPRPGAIERDRQFRLSRQQRK